MAYSEKDDQIVLTISREDYSMLLMSMGTGSTLFKNTISWLAWCNRVNAGNPEYRPYLQAEKA